MVMKRNVNTKNQESTLLSSKMQRNGRNSNSVMCWSWWGMLCLLYIPEGFALTNVASTDNSATCEVLTQPEHTGYPCSRLLDGSVGAYNAMLLLAQDGTYRGVSFIIRFSDNYLVQLVRTHQAYGPTSNQDIEHVNITWSNDQSQMVTLHPGRLVLGYDEFEITPPVLTSSITFTVESMYGTPGDTGFAEIEVYSKPHVATDNSIWTIDLGDLQYYIDPDVSLSWFLSKLHCQSLGGRLAVFQNVEEETAVRTWLSNNGHTTHFWVFGKRTSTGAWVWSNDGSTLTSDLQWNTFNPTSESSHNHVYLKADSGYLMANDDYKSLHTPMCQRGGNYRDYRTVGQNGMSTALNKHVICSKNKCVRRNKQSMLIS